MAQMAGTQAKIANIHKSHARFDRLMRGIRTMSALPNASAGMIESGFFSAAPNDPSAAINPGAASFENKRAKFIAGNIREAKKRRALITTRIVPTGVLTLDA